MQIGKFTPQLLTSKRDGREWHALEAEEVLNHLETPAEHGLTAQEAASRLEHFGPNQLLETPPPTFWQMLWSQFNNFVVILLIAASAISAPPGRGGRSASRR
jgi:Ca2+-transporting ATPase